MEYTRKGVGIGIVGGILIAIAIIGSLQTYFTYGSGKLLLLITDPPQWEDVAQVYIKCSKIEIHKKGGRNEDAGWITILQNLGWINLTEVLESSKVLGEADLQAGTYDQIRFYISNAVVTVGGGNKTAEVKSGKLRVTIMYGGITVKTGQASKLLVDFETMVKRTPKGYMIIPKAIRAVPIND